MKMNEWLKSIRLVLGCTSSLLYTVKQAVNLWRTASPESADATDVDETLFETARDTGEIIKEQIEPVVQTLETTFEDGKIDEEELADLTKKIWRYVATDKED